MICFPFSVWDAPWLAPCALVLDLWLGDPTLPWRHPVCLIGKLLDMLERPARRFMEKHSLAGIIRGRMLGGCALALSCLFIYCLVRLALALPCFNWLLALYLAWAGLAMGCLLKTGEEVLDRLENSPLPAAREGVSWLVSRETAHMDRVRLRKTLADTLSENFTDAFMAPFFWLLMTGPAGLWIYKVVSTMDSQWGYKTSRWLALGWAGAKSDDLLAFIPARLSPIALRIGYFIRRHVKGARDMDLWPGFWSIAREAAGMPSPNSGWSMSACAWLCQAPMAGPDIYFGQFISKPSLGPQNGALWDCERLSLLCSIMRYGALNGALLIWAVFLALRSLA